MKKNTIDIICKLSEKIWIGLGNTRENYGHDDSLPYQADIYIHDADNCPEGDTSFKRVGTIYNDGWGGDSDISAIAAPKAAENIQTLMHECRKHQLFWNGKAYGTYKLEDVCDFMASLFIDNPKLASKGTLEYLMDDDPRSDNGKNCLAIIKK